MCNKTPTICNILMNKRKWNNNLCLQVLNTKVHGSLLNLFTLPGFARTLSIEDLDDLTDDEIDYSLSTSSRFNLRISQVM